MADNYTQPDSGEYSPAEIYKKHSGLIRKVIRCHVKDECQADDIFQDFFLHLVANPLPDDVENIEAYLYRAVINCIIDSMRNTTRYRDYVGEYARNISLLRAENTPENPVIDSDELAKTFRLIREQLPHSEAQAVTLRYGDNRDIIEIADIMGVNTRSASRYVSTGLKRIYQIMAATEGNNI